MPGAGKRIRKSTDSGWKVFMVSSENIMEKIYAGRKTVISARALCFEAAGDDCIRELSYYIV